MKVLLTGATGLIGKNLGIDLVREGHQVIVLSRDATRARLDCPFPAEHCEWGQLEQIPKMSIDAVVHLAGESIAGGFWTKDRKKKIIDSRVETTSRLVNVFKTSGKIPKVWINASAIGFYGDRQDEVLTEESKKGTGFLSQVCVKWEEALLPLQDECRLVIYRFGVVLSKRSGALSAMMPAFRLGLGGHLGSGKQWMSWIHEDDLRAAIVFGLKSDKLKGVANLVSPTPVTNSQFTQTLNLALSKNNFLPIPRFALELAGEISQLVLASQKVVPNVLMQAGFKFSYDTLEIALRNLIDYQMRSGVFEIYQAQWVPKTVTEIFPFFCDEKNLEELTPELLNFKVIGKNTPMIQEGTLIDYKLKIRGVPAKWRTRIIDWKPGKSFVDTQLKGPYNLWHHTHEFKDLGGGTLMTDRVLYKTPLWPLSIAVLPLIRHDVGAIFNYRRRIVAKMFGSS
ncbi:MAG: TIGR01777 family oxidoreductase [Proteobacteria bacterium]|nr:TIGR01777 family oxidoreductase [Pseudomonadota bacterium]